MNQLVIRDRDWITLSRYLTERRDVESAVYACYKLSRSSENTKILMNQILIPRDHDYLKRTTTSVVMHPGFTEQAFRMAEKTGGHLLDIHTHPWSEHVQFSGTDDYEATKTKIPYMAKYLPGMMIAFIVFGKYAHIVQGRFWETGKNHLQLIDRIIVI